MVNLNDIRNVLEKKFSNAQVWIEDTKNDGYHFEINIVAEEFQDKSHIERHQMIYNALGNWVGNEIHALSIDAKTPNEAKDNNTNDFSKENNEKPLHNDILKKIDEAVHKYDVILFMKGNKQTPMCGFSMQVNQILLDLGVDFMDVNILASNELRENIKIYSNWPTIPQLYIKGNFIGGCDITREMYENGSLQELLKKYNLLKSD